MPAERTIFSVMNSLFAKTLLAQALVWFVLRFYETWKALSYDIPSTTLLLQETLGWLIDISLSAVGVLLLFPFLSVLRLSEKAASFVIGVFISFFALLHLPILAYFLYQFQPLDAGLFHYSLDEVLFTIKAANTSSLPYLLLAVLIVTLMAGAFMVCDKFLSNQSKKGMYLVMVFATLFFGSLFLPKDYQNTLFRANKSMLFYQSLLNSNTDESDPREVPVTSFQNSLPNREFVSNEYPLLHNFQRDSALVKCFSTLPKQPNIVLLIVEGLSYDFLHEFKGIQMLPFISSLEKKSLSWSRCFSLGERSFAVVPSILGGLPYGTKGFTLLPFLPNHTSLISTLKPHGYHTAFFYGQGAWFHRKRRFFDYNYCDDIIDNSVYDKRYNKIRVGDDDFFWGYHDKDLFSQAIDVLDSIPHKKPKFHVYFTGTTHSPFVIDSVATYDAWFNETIAHTNSNNQTFLTRYKEQVQSLKFADDAIKDFFATYQTRDDFDRTIFIITGDHAMSEIPSQNELKKYHVPLIMYSPLLETHQQFTTPTSHLDLYESLLTMTYSKDSTFLSSSIGNTLPQKDDSLSRWFALMDGSRNIQQLVYDNWFYDNGTLYQFDQHVKINEVHNDSVKQSLSNTLQRFKAINTHVCRENKIIDISNYVHHLHHKLVYFIDTLISEPIQAEYHNIISKLPLESQSSAYYIEVNLAFSSEPENVQLALNLVDSTGKSIHQEVHGIALEEGDYQKRLELKLDEHQKQGRLTVFVYNPNKEKYKLNKQTALIHFPKARATPGIP